ncbi:MAG: hypothetical protein AAGI08_13365 [Bacteroidota bacterium]
MRASCLLAALFFVTAAYGQAIPAQISYQGYLEFNGAPATGTVDLTFRLYIQATGPGVIWGETQTDVLLNDGVYQVTLGSVMPLPVDEFEAPLWLGVRVNNGGELTPRTALLPAPYALGLRLPLVGTSTEDGVWIKRAGSPSSTLSDNSSNGFQVDGAQGNGLHVGWAGGEGVRIRETRGAGVLIDKTNDEGLKVQEAGQEGVSIGRSSRTGFKIEDTQENGLFVGRADDDGVRVESAGKNGVHVDSAAIRGVYVGRVGSPSTTLLNSSPSPRNGFEVAGAAGSGLVVGRADLDGIYVASAGRFGAYIQSTPATTDGSLTASYVAYFDNTGTSPSSDVLALQVAPTSTPGNPANFVGFFGGSGTVIGQIDGNGAGGVQYSTTGADYAEYLPIAGCSSSTCGLEAGTVVGVKAGLVSLSTEDADEVLVISTRPAVVGNAPQGESTEGFAAIAMLGQADVRVTGSVDAGDYVLASGRGDGTAVAVPASEISVEMLERLIGRAWGAKPGAGEGTVNVAVGLDRTEVLADLLQTERNRVSRLERELADLRQMIDALAAR